MTRRWTRCSPSDSTVCSCARGILRGNETISIINMNLENRSLCRPGLVGWCRMSGQARTGGAESGPVCSGGPDITTAHNFSIYHSSRRVKRSPLIQLSFYCQVKTQPRKNIRTYCTIYASYRYIRKTAKSPPPMYSPPVYQSSVSVQDVPTTASSVQEEITAMRNSSALGHSPSPVCRPTLASADKGRSVAVDSV